MRRRFAQVDVFTDEAFVGNPLAVVLDAEGLIGEQMQRIAAWTNLSETTFVAPPRQAGADYSVRIFTPVAELPFAGHPTLGSAHAWLAAGGVPADPDLIVQECAAGLIPIRRVDTGLAFAAPPLVRSGPVEAADADELVGALGLNADEVLDLAWVDNGPGWVGLLLDSVERLLALNPAVGSAPHLGDVGLAALHPGGSGPRLEVRAFFRGRSGPVEDPVTGSLNASLAQWLIEAGHLSAPYVAAQGTAMGRAGRVHVARQGEQIWVGGGTVTVVEGTISA